ncbi:MAG: DUF3179 domain-containing protein [Anaerolineae bacterium]
MLWQKWKIRWPLTGLILLLALAACTTTGSEPAADNDSGSAVTSAGNDNQTENPATAVPPTDVPATEAPAPAANNQVEVTILEGDDRSDRLKALTSRWDTNWELRTISTEEILSGGPPRDGIPSIDKPEFISFAEAADWLADVEPVISLEINGDARAYPLQILTWHEIVNDTVGGVPVAVTFCPLCNSAITFDRQVGDEVLEFGTSGLLRNSDLIMYDRTTESLWQQFTGDAIIGDMVGTRLTFLPSSLISYADFRTAFPDGQVLSRNTGFARRYGENPYVGYDDINNNPFLYTGIPDDQLPAMARVVTISFDDLDVAYPLDILIEAGIINDSPGGHDLVVFHTGGTTSALGARVIADAEDIGATGVFDPNLDGQKLTFVKQGDAIVDEQTNSMWNILGQATDGPLAGKALTPIIHADHFWFSWAAFRPDTIIFSQ